MPHDILTVALLADLDFSVDDDEKSVGPLTLADNDLAGLQFELGKLGVDASGDRRGFRRGVVDDARLHRNGNARRVLEIDKVKFEGWDPLKVHQRLAGKAGQFLIEEP
jgi:hypothetical protein